MNYDWQLFKMLFYFILIIIIIIVLARIMKKTLMTRKNGDYITLIDQFYLNQKCCLNLVKIKDKIFLIGTSSEQTQKLAEWSEEEFGEIEINKNENYRKKFKEVLKENWRDRR